MRKIEKAIYANHDEIYERIAALEADAAKMQPGTARQSVLIEASKLRTYADLKRWMQTPSPAEPQRVGLESKLKKIEADADGCDLISRLAVDPVKRKRFARKAQRLNKAADGIRSDLSKEADKEDGINRTVTSDVPNENSAS